MSMIFGVYERIFIFGPLFSGPGLEPPWITGFYILVHLIVKWGLGAARDEKTAEANWKKQIYGYGSKILGSQKKTSCLKENKPKPVENPTIWHLFDPSTLMACETAPLPRHKFVALCEGLRTRQFHSSSRSAFEGLFV